MITLTNPPLIEVFEGVVEAGMVDNGAIAEVGAEEFYCVVASGVAVEMKRDAAEAVFCDAVERAAAKGNGV